MRKYLAPNDTHQITVPIIVGAEYAVPVGDGKLIIRSAGVDNTSVVSRQETTEVVLNLQTPSVNAGELKLINYLFTIPTAAGLFQKRESLGVVDLLDIPATADDVRNELGVTSEELEDDHIDYIEFYLKYYSSLKPEFHTARQTNEYLTKKFGDLIAVSAAIEIAPTLITRLDKKRATENGDVTRLGSASDLADLMVALNTKLAGILDDLVDFIDQTTEAVTTVFQFISTYQHSIGQ